MASGAIGRSQSIGAQPGAGRRITTVVPGIHRGRVADVAAQFEDEVGGSRP